MADKLEVIERSQKPCFDVKKKNWDPLNLYYRTKARSRDKFTETNVLSIGKQQKNISNGYLYLLLTVSKHFRLTQKKRTLKKRK